MLGQKNPVLDLISRLIILTVIVRALEGQLGGFRNGSVRTKQSTGMSKERSLVSYVSLSSRTIVGSMEETFMHTATLSTEGPLALLDTLTLS